MSDTLGVTTFLTVISTVTKTPQPTTITTVLTILVQGSGAVTESYTLNPIETPSVSASKELSSSFPMSTATLPSTATDVVTISVTLTPSPTRTSPTVSPNSPSTLNTGISKPAIIILAMLGPLIATVVVLMVWRIRRTRRKQPKPSNDQGRNSSRTWFTKILKHLSAENKSVDELPWQLPDEGVGEAKNGGLSAAAAATEPAPLNSKRWPLRPATGQPSRPSRPTSLSMSIREVMRTRSADSPSRVIESGHDNTLPAHNSARGMGNTSPQSWTGIPMDEHAHAYDGTRRVFYETALKRNLPFDMLSRPSLRLEKLEEADNDRSLTPDPLRIVKKKNFAGAANKPLNEGQGGMRRAHTEPLITPPYVPRDVGESIEEDLIEELNSIDGSFIDEETRRKQREDTLNYLEGVLPMSPPKSYSASSVYSRNIWGSPILRQEQQTPSTPLHNSRPADGGSSEPEGKGKAVDRLGIEGGKWI